MGSEWPVVTSCGKPPQLCKCVPAAAEHVLAAVVAHGQLQQARAQLLWPAVTGCGQPMASLGDSFCHAVLASCSDRLWLTTLITRFLLLSCSLALTCTHTSLPASSRVWPTHNQMLTPRNTGGVRIRVTRLNGLPITHAAVYPARSGATVASITAQGAVEVLVPSAARFTLTLDGGLDDVDTGPNYAGPPIHTLSCFVNPFLATPDRPSVFTVAAGKPVPQQLPHGVTAVVFGPGEHRMQPVPPAKWPIWTLPDSVRVHVQMDAVLYFALQSSHADNITLEGFGSVSGEEMQRCLGDHHHNPNIVDETSRDGTAKSCTNNSPQGLTLQDFAVKQASVSGVTFIDFPNHHIIAGASNKPCGAEGDTVSVIENVKVMGWRANGDGIHVFGHWLVKDVFLRTQDDSLYLQVTDGPRGNHFPPKWY